MDKNATPANQVASCVAHPQQQSPLFSRIPPEIRLHILEATLCVKPSDTGVKVKYTPADNCNGAPSVLAVLSTCRRILAEAEVIFYADNRLAVGENDCRQFLTHLTLRRRTAITKLTLSARYAFPTLDAVRGISQHCPNLKSIHIHRNSYMDQEEFQWWEFSAKALKAELGKMRLADMDILCPDAALGPAEQALHKLLWTAYRIDWEKV